MQHLTAVHRDRPMSLILTALKARFKELVESGAFAGECKKIVNKAMGVIQDRFSARLSVHLWDRLELSRRKMDDLMHLVSCIYRPLSNSYDRIVVWVNPDDPNDFLEMPIIVGRAGRESLFSTLAEAGEITVGDNGRCERDAVTCAQQLYSRFAKAMRSDFSHARPARPILYFDGTGGSLGKGITHAELGSADFTGDCLQSRSTLSPLALYAGNDHALPLRSNMSLCVKTFNALSDAAQIQLDDGTCIPCEPIVVGDMQGLKCIMGMTESCHAVWCKCRARGQLAGEEEGAAEGPQHQYGDAESKFESYEDVLAFYDEVGCEFKTEDFLLSCAHLSKGLYHGGSFTPFECPDCGYKPTAAAAKADLAQFNAMTDAEQAAARKAHVVGGAHWHVELFMGPMCKGFGMLRAGVDQLHLVYLNMFKHLFKYTIHEPLPESQKKLVANYLEEAGFYSYSADDDSDDPVKRWIGREVKRFLHEADLHLPFLLRLAAGQIDVCAETLAATNERGEEEMDVSDDDFEPTEEEVAEEAARTPLLAQNALRWDQFLEWVRDIQAAWLSDTDAYRKLRAVLYCNGARAVARALHELKPTLASWVPHIACNIVPRQIVALGDPGRRSADACESMGACTKKVVKFLTCRREITSKFTRGWVEQAFRRMVVRSDLLHGAENEPFMQRQDARLLGLGRTSAARPKVEGPAHSIRVKIEQEADLS